MGIEKIKLSVLMHTCFSRDIAFIFLTCYAKKSHNKKGFYQLCLLGRKIVTQKTVFTENTIASQEQTPEHKD